MPYEGLVIFPESMQETDLDQAIGKVTGEVERLGGRMLGVERIGRKTFARPMRKREAGNYIRVGFELAPGIPAALDACPGAGRPKGRSHEQGGERHAAFAGFQAEEEMFHWAWGALGASDVLRRAG